MILTLHAKQRRKEMGVTEDQILEALTEPECVYPGDSCHASGRFCFQRGELVVVTAPDRETVLTVLWHGRDSR